MQLHKFKHACFTVTKDMQTIVIDPGSFSTDFVVPDDVIGIIVTHNHPDHLDPAKIQAILDRNPNATVYGASEALEGLMISQKQSVQATDTLNVGPFNLSFYGGKHAIIDPSIPPIANLGVMINDFLYYPGDSFVTPDTPVRALALPLSAPWTKVSETIAFLTAIKPDLAFPTHDAILSPEGKEIYDRLLQNASQQNNIDYQRLTTPIQLT